MRGSLTAAASRGDAATSRPTHACISAALVVSRPARHAHILGPTDDRHPRPFPWQLEAGDKLKPILLVVGGGTALSIPFYFVRHSLRTRSPSSLTRPAAPPLAAAPYRRPPRPQPRAPASLSALPRTPGGWRGRVAFPDAAPPMAMRVAKRVCA